MYVTLQSHPSRQYDSIRLYSLKTETASVKFGAENVFALTGENHRQIAREIAKRAESGRKLMLPYDSESDDNVRRLKACLIGYGFKVEAWPSPFAKKATRTGNRGNQHTARPPVVPYDTSVAPPVKASAPKATATTKAKAKAIAEPKAKKAKSATYQQGTGNLARDIAMAIAPSLKRDVDEALIEIMKASYGIA